MAEHRMDAGEWAILGALSILWGGSFFFYKVLVVELPPFTVVFGRMAIAAVALNLLMLARRTPLRIGPGQAGAFVLMALLNNVVPFSLFAFGETRIASGLAAILNATTPLFTVVVAHILTDDGMTASKVAGLLLGLAGVAVLTGPGLTHALGGDLVGEGACLLAALSYGFGANYSRRFRALPPLTVATAQTTASLVWLIPLVGLVDRPWQRPLPAATTWSALVGIALLSTALAYLLFFRLLRTAGPTNLVLVTLLSPISALLLGALFLGETITGHALAGMALIGVSLAAIDGRLWARLTHSGA